MSTRNFALIGGILMLSLGCLSLVPALNNGADTLPVLYVNTSYGLFLNLFPMNIFNKITMIVFGLLGMSAYFSKASLNNSIFFSKVIFWVMGALALLGLFPQTNTISGYWPLFGNEIAPHGIIALLGGFFGFLSQRENDHNHTHRMHKI